MKKRRSDHAGRWVAVALACALGGFVCGRRTSPAPPGPVVTLLACPQAPACGPPAAVGLPAGPRRRPPALARGSPPPSPLPALAPTDERRVELLRFIRDRSDGLGDCAADRRERLRLTVRIDVGERGKVRRVQVLDADPAQQAVAQCLSQHMSAWLLPGEWSASNPSLLVAVVL